MTDNDDVFTILMKKYGFTFKQAVECVHLVLTKYKGASQ